ncbi:hypothetical protein [Cupriavidus metallidurans]|uniref:hypothetical protein n=1 Tax=Cupriavidus metallidurans TaxID=119219 RepID=UPI001646B3C3|nr:hypothetical protein [Cupriavidus metallidurans]
MAEKLDLDALIAELRFCLAEGFSGPRTQDALRAAIRALESASQPGSGEALAKALAMYDSMRDGIGGCTDGGCVIKRATGMRTNGGCKCATDKYKAQRMMYAGQKLADAARASLDGRS